LKFSDAQRAALLDFINSGKGLFGVHAATDGWKDWPDMAGCIGGSFAGHPWGAGDTVAVKNDAPDHVCNESFGGHGFWIKDEIYQFDESYTRDNRRVLLSLDMSQPRNERNGIRRADRDVGISWAKRVGQGRVFYCSLGHNDEVFWTPQVVAHYFAGLRYALGDLAADDTPAESYHAVPASAVPLTLLQAAELRWLVTPAAVAFLTTYQLGTDDALAVRWRDGVRTLAAADRESVARALADAGEIGKFSPAGLTVALAALDKLGGTTAVPWLRTLVADDDATVSGAAAPVLAKLSPSAAAEVLPTVSDGAKIGILDSLAEQGNNAAAAAAVKLVNNNANADVAWAAAYYIGAVGDDAAVGKLPADVVWVRAAAGERAVREGRTETARKIFTLLSEKKNPAPVRRAALRGLALAGDIAPFFFALVDADETFRKELARVAVTLPVASNMPALLAKSFALFPADVQLLLIDNIANLRVADKFYDVVRAGVQAQDVAVQNLALATLGYGGHAQDFDTLAAALADGDAAKVGAVLQVLRHPPVPLTGDAAKSAAGVLGLSRLTADGVGAAVLKAASAASDDLQPLWLEVVAARGDHATLPFVIDAVKSAQPGIRNAAFIALKNLADAGDLPAVLALRPLAVEGRDLGPWRETVLKIARFYSRSGDLLGTLTPAAKQAAAADQPLFAEALAIQDVPEVEAPLKELLSVSDLAQRKEIIRAVSRVRCATTVRVLMAHAAAAPDDAEKILALRGALDSLPAAALKEPEKLAFYEQAWPLAARDEEKSTIVSELKKMKQRFKEAGELMKKLGIAEE
ncbi:MAG: ThuA domain-containing protein, partial [Verrucomicrobiales bacterium]|nr:ThuA domain-containing protein [Verrucomicrobiales bacterium]